MASATQTLDRVLDGVRSAGDEGVTAEQLAGTVGVSADTVRKAFKRLEEDGKVRREGQRAFPVKRQGRRDLAVIERDEKVLTAIRGGGAAGISLNEIAEQVGTTGKLAYQSVWRLRENGQVARVGDTRNARWAAAQANVA